MFCHACGAKNLAESRFCNMCGVPFARPSAPVPVPAAPERPAASSLDSTQLGIAGAAEAARRIAEGERNAPQPRASFASTPVGLPVVAAPINTAAAASVAVVTAPAPVATPAPVVAPALVPASTFPQAEPSAPAAPAAPILSVTSSHSLRDESLRKAGFDPRLLDDPSVSMHLAALGIVSKKKTWTILIAGGLAFLLLGGIATYFAMRNDDAPQGTAHEGDPFTIGAPTPEVDYVSGSSDPNTPMVPGTRDGGRPASTTGTASTHETHATTGSATTGSLPPPDTTGSTTTGSIPPPDTTGTTTTGTTETTGSTTTGTTETTGTTTTGTTDANPEMDMEMYAARVRYLVRRYYAGRAQSCFNEATAQNPSLSGQVVLSIHINTEGQVSGARVRSNTTGDDGLGSCLASQANSWQVGPPPGGETDMSFPFSR